MRAHLCFYRPGGEFECEHNADLEGLPRGGGATYRALVPANVGVEVGWRVIVNGMACFRVSSAAPAAGAVAALLTRTASTPGG